MGFAEWLNSGKFTLGCSVGLQCCGFQNQIQVSEEQKGLWPQNRGITKIGKDLKDHHVNHQVWTLTQGLFSIPGTSCLETTQQC